MRREQHEDGVFRQQLTREVERRLQVALDLVRLAAGAVSERRRVEDDGIVAPPAPHLARHELVRVVGNPADGMVRKAVQRRVLARRIDRILVDVEPGDREKAELHVAYTNGTIESILIEPPERQLQNMIQGREPVSARMAEKIEIPALRVLPETFTVDVLINRPSSLEGDWVSVRRTDTCLRNADGTWSVSVGIERDSSQELAILEQQFRHSVFEAERLEKKRLEELEKELTDINRGREDDGYIPGVYEPEYGH